MWNGTLTPEWRKSTEHTSNPEWEVADVIDGFASVIVHFNHYDIKNGKRKAMPSNQIGYEYLIQVGFGKDEGDVREDIEARLGDKYTCAELVALLETD